MVPIPNKQITNKLYNKRPIPTPIQFPIYSVGFNVLFLIQKDSARY